MNRIWKAAGAVAWGATAFSGLRAFPPEEAACLALCPNAQTVLVGAFPYYAGEEPGNLSLYCRGEDYHRVLKRRLDGICAVLQERYPNACFVPGADNSPVNERVAAERAGLGFRGRHGLLIVKPYGSYVFLGTILTDCIFEETGSGMLEHCPENCGACEKACPTGALSGGRCDPAKCLSALTQAKGDLSPTVLKQIAASPTIWGCDICQRVCPQNRKVPLTPIPEFRENLQCSITLAELEGLSNKGFRKAYADRAFAWRGLPPLLRNLAAESRF